MLSTHNQLANVSLSSILGALSIAPDDEVSDAIYNEDDLLWYPNVGPQLAAYFCEADELFYGGQAGGGKSQVLLGLALNEHTHSLILRRTAKETQGLVDDMASIIGNRNAWNQQQGTWRLGKKTIEMSGCQLEEDKQKFKGVAHDFYGFDEISDFTESQYRFITGWNRSTIPGQRCRIVAAGNPPTSPEGVWVIHRWAAWLDPNHPNPAKHGELRWYTTGADGREVEVDGRGPHNINGEMIEARSRTFIPGKLQDNPDLMNTGYAATLAALPEELRAAYKDGRFDLGLKDGAYQTIPTSWVRAAQERWTSKPPHDVPMCCIGVDVAQGGGDNTVLAIRHDEWFAPLIVVPGVDTPDGPSVAGLVIQHRRDEAKVVIDMGGGYGGSALTHLKGNGVDAVGYKGSEGSSARTNDRQMKFQNTRSEAYWKFREALDPGQSCGSSIALPPDPTLVADLTAPTFKVDSNKIKLEPKDVLVKRLGRSPDKGDAVVMCWFRGLKQSNITGGFKSYASSKVPTVVGGRSLTHSRKR